MSVFISYSSKDSDFVNTLCAELVKHRIQVWLDKWEMKPGDSLIDKIQTALTESSFLLVLLSKNSVESEWCKKELNSGLMRELQEKQVLVIPIMLDDCKVPLFLQEKIYADFRTDFETGFKELLRPLSKLFSKHMGRKQKNEIITDYATNWGVIDGLYYLDIDLVNWYEKERKSILLQLHFTGCKNVTAKFMKQLEMGNDWLMKETIIGMLYLNKDFRDLNILIQNDEIYRFHIKTFDPKQNLTIDCKIRASLMGEDNGNNLLINFADFAEMLYESAPERVRKNSR